MNNKWLMEVHGQNELWINKDAAAARGINDGDMVTVESPYASAKAKARATALIHPETVALLHGFGHTGFGPTAQGKGCNDGQFLPGKAEAMSGMAIHKEVAVKVYK